MKCKGLAHLLLPLPQSNNLHWKLLQLPASTIADRYEDAIEAARPDVLFYFSYPELDPVIDKTPYKEQVAEIRKIKAQGRSKEALTLMSDKMVEDLTVSGTPKECRDKIKKLADYGVTLPIIRVSVQPFEESKRREVFVRAINTMTDR
jgi:alkanesulfonate monooxygenase SsuD/methylene tetrahydromethanopterin reductase-like flavin-dependent oxidoreductase (luciferase family)